MKTTADGKEVPGRCWYYLLDYNDLHRDMLPRHFGGKYTISSLTSEEFWRFFKLTSEIDHATYY